VERDGQISADDAGEARRGTACPACAGDATSWTGLTTKSRYALHQCNFCATQFYVDPAGQSGDGESHYKWESYKLDVYSDEKVRKAFEDRYAALLDLARPVAGSLTSVLDVGCGIGNFVAFAHSSGLRAIGSDVSALAVEEARRRGLEVVLSQELDSLVGDGSIDALTLWDVIEHVQDPRVFLKGLVRKVRPGGVLLFETPDAEFPVRSALLRAYRATRGKLDLTGPMYYWEHKIYFTEIGLRLLLAGVGVDIVLVQRQTSVREKMRREFAVKKSLKGRVLRAAWPALETFYRRTGRGNKLLVIARRR